MLNESNEFKENIDVSQNVQIIDTESSQIVNINNQQVDMETAIGYSDAMNNTISDVEIGNLILSASIDHLESFDIDETFGILESPRGLGI